mmetsp:Transcript_100270/g.282873  ORF Transcript_100270/g.282873 Transcript_100270/m.282873 type:complete len:214 (-) Transcript_100270:132-773(-)
MHPCFAWRFRAASWSTTASRRTALILLLASWRPATFSHLALGRCAQPATFSRPALGALSTARGQLSGHTPCSGTCTRAAARALRSASWRRMAWRFTRSFGTPRWPRSQRRTGCCSTRPCFGPRARGGRSTSPWPSVQRCASPAPGRHRRTSCGRRASRLSAPHRSCWPRCRPTSCRNCGAFSRGERRCPRPLLHFGARRVSGSSSCLSAPSTG